MSTDSVRITSALADRYRLEREVAQGGMDGHLLELLAPLATPQRPDLGILSWAEWTRVVEGVV